VRAASGVRDGVTGIVSVKGATRVLLRFLQQWIKPDLLVSFLRAVFLELLIFSLILSSLLSLLSAFIFYCSVVYFLSRSIFV
jgi:hypothetical protein